MGTISLGILAGGLGTRADNQDKALLKRDGIAQVERLISWGETHGLPSLLNSNRDPENYKSWAVSLIKDRDNWLGNGPAAGILSLLQVCETTHLLTLPVDIAAWPDDLDQILMSSMRLSSAEVVICEDDNGVQPLCGLWNVRQCASWLEDYLHDQRWAIHSLSKNPHVNIYRLSGLQFGNLNTLNDYDSL